MAGVPATPKSTSKPVQPQAETKRLDTEAGAPTQAQTGADADKFESSKSAAPSKVAVARANDEQLTATLTSWQKLRGDAPKAVSKAQLDNAVGAALGVQPNHLPKTDADNQKLLDGTWPYFEGQSLKSVQGISAAISKASGEEQPRVGVIPFAFKAEGKSEQELMALFRVENASGQRFVDTNGRTYDSLDAWKNENVLQPGTVTFPKNGLLTAPTGQGLNELVSAPTPSVRDTMSENLVAVGDTVALAGGLALGAAAVVGSGGMLLPVVGGAALSLYSIGRSGYGLYEAAEHGESLSPITNPRARSQWIGVASSAIGLGAMGSTMAAVSSVATTGKLAPGLAQLAPGLAVASQVAGTVASVDQGVNLAVHWSEMTPAERLLGLSQLAFFGGSVAQQARAMGGVRNLFSPSAYRQALKPLDADVAVVGYGAAGKAAANEVVDGGKTVTVLEGRDRTGGRVHTDRDNALGVPFDKGASWVVAPEKNPHTKALKAAGIELDQTNFEGPLYLGKGMASDADQESFGATYEAFREAMAKQAKRGDVPADYKMPKGMPFEQLVRETIGESAVGAPMSAVSGRDASRHEFATDAIPKQGMDQYVEVIAGKGNRDIPIALNTKAVAVRHMPDGVEIDTADGNTIYAKRTIITAPTSVLAKGMIAFDPPLPPKTAKAIQELPLGDFLKVGLKFDKKLFGETHNVWETAGTTDGTPSMWFLTEPHDQNTVIGFLGGAEAAKFAKLPPQAAVDRAMTALRGMYPDGNVEQHLMASLTTDWGNDELTGGGTWSYATPGNFQARTDLRRPVADRLWFTGEATAPLEWTSTVTGALLAGKRDGKAVVRSLNRDTTVSTGPARLSRDLIGPRAMRPALSTIGVSATENDDE